MKYVSSACAGLACLTVYGYGCVIYRPQGGEPSKSSQHNSKPEVVPLKERERAQIAESEAYVLKLLRARYGDVKLDHTEQDLGLIQRLFDDKAIQPKDKKILDALGIVMGQIWVSRTKLKWAVVAFDHRRMLVLNLPKTGISINPKTVFSKRMKKGEVINVTSIYRSMVSAINDLEKRLKKVQRSR